ncbi:MAG: ferrochelatase [Lysobacter sp.]
MNDSADRTPDTAVVLVNLGTPDAPTADAVRRYLAEFLSDRRVVALPRLFWLPLLHGVILPRRSPKVALKYASVWLDGGSPLAVYTRRLAEGVQRVMPDVLVMDAMRYGNPSLTAVLAGLRERGIRRVLGLPLYPQYSTTTTASVGDVLARETAMQVRMVEDYHVDAGWVAAVADSIRAYRARNGAGEHLVFSFHGLPKRVIRNGDPYQRHSEAGAQAIATALGLQPHQWTLSYQSRFGAERWLEPATTTALAALGERGVGQIDVVAPGFAADCLETLEEISMELAAEVAGRGGRLRYIPCLNDSPAHAEVIAAIAGRELQAWTVAQT